MTASCWRSSWRARRAGKAAEEAQCRQGGLTDPRGRHGITLLAGAVEALFIDSRERTLLWSFPPFDWLSPHTFGVAIPRLTASRSPIALSRRLTAGSPRWWARAPRQGTSSRRASQGAAPTRQFRANWARKTARLKSHQALTAGWAANHEAAPSQPAHARRLGSGAKKPLVFIPRFCTFSFWHTAGGGAALG